MFAIAKALIRIALEVRRIREILEVAYADSLERYDYYKSYKPTSKRASDYEFTVQSPELDLYGDRIERDSYGRIIKVGNDEEDSRTGSSSNSRS